MVKAFICCGAFFLYAGTQRATAPAVNVTGRAVPHHLDFRSGPASWYGPCCFTRDRADQSPYQKDAVFVASPDLPFGTKLMIVNPMNGRRIIAPVRDRGPYIKGRVLDLSVAAADALDMREQGVITVHYAIVSMPQKSS